MTRDERAAVNARIIGLIDSMSKPEMIAECMRILMTLAGEPEEAINAQVEKCLNGGDRA